MDNASIGQILKKVHHNQAEIKRRRMTLYFISYVGGTIMAAMAWLNISSGDTLLVTSLSLSALFVFINVAFSYLYKDSEVVYHIAGIVVLCMVTALFYTGGYSNTGLYFIYPLIFAQIIVVGFKPALLYVAVTMALGLVMLLNQTEIPAYYDSADVSRFLISMLCFITIAFIGEYFWNQSRKEMLQDTLEKMRQANTDPLTKLPNRRFLEAVYFERAMQNPADYFPLSTVIVDLDHFKKVNDTYGHDVGDDVLVHCAQVMKGDVRTTDIVARTGGEEFLILFPKTTLSQALKLAEKIREKLADTPFKNEEIELSITASFGVANALIDSNINAALKQADDNLYQAKNSGRNKVV